MRAIERTDTAIGLFIGRGPWGHDSWDQNCMPAAWARDEQQAAATRTVEVSGDADIAELIAHAVNIGALDPDDLPDLRVYVDGVAAPFATFEEKAETLDLRPGPGAIVNLQVEPAGGSNNLARTVLTVVLTAVAVVSAFTVGAFTAGLWQLGAAIIPQLVFPIQSPDRLASPNDQGGLNSQSNTMRPRGMMPLQLGAGRVAFDVAANAYSSHINGDTWLTVIFGVHYGPCTVEDIKIGETLLSDYPASDIQVEQILLPGPRNFSFYAQSVHQENLSDELDIGGAAEVHTTAEECERVEIDLTWPSGLQFRKDSGSIVQQEIRCQVRWAPVGTEDWQAAPLEGGPYRDRLGNALPTGTVDVMARTQDPVRRTFGWDKANADQIKIEVKAWDPDNDDATKATQATYWTAIRSIVKKQPIVDEYLSCVALRIKSSDDLGGTLPTVTGKVTPHAPVWTGSTWKDDLADWEASDNAAAHVRMMLLGPGAARPVDPVELGESFGVVHDLIEERQWKGCYRLETEATQEDALKILGAIGRFSAYDAGEGLVLVPDWEKLAPRQLFTGRNVQNYSYTRTFPDPCHAVVVEFLNVDEDGKQDEVTVYNTGYSAYGDDDTLPATLLETIRLDWQCSGERATREGYVFLAKRNVSVEAHDWTAGPSAIASSYGSRVLLRHYSALYGQGEGRVQFRHLSGGLVTGVRLDDEVEMLAGETYALDVQRADRIIPGVVVVTAAGRTRDLMFPTPLTADNAPEAGDLVAFGRAEIVTEDLEIIDFAPAGDQVQISARKYVGPQLVEAETGEIPEFTTKLTPTAKAPKPRLLGVTAASPDGVKIAFDVAEVRGDLIENFPVRWRRSSTAEAPNPWVAAPTVAANARLAVTPPFPDAVSAGKDPDAAYRVDVEIRSKLRSGDVSEPLLVSNVLITRTPADPTGFVAYGAAREGDDGSKYPVLYVAVDPLVSGLEQDLIVEARPNGGGDGDWYGLGKLPATNPKGDIPGQAPGAVLDVRVQWRTSDNYTSNWLERLGVTIPTGSLVASDTIKFGDLIAADLTKAVENVRAATLEIEKVRAGAQVEIDAILKKLNEAIDGKPLAPVIKEHKEVITSTLVQVGENKAAIEYETLARETAISSEAYARLTLASNFDTFSASATQQFSTITTNLAATSAAVTNLTADYNGNKSTVSASLLAHTNSLESLASAQMSLATTVGNNKSSADQSILTLTNATSALSSSLTSLQTTVGNNKSSADQSISSLTTQQSATAQTLTNLSTDYNGNKSTVNNSLTALSNTQGAQATTLSNLGVTVGGHTSSISSIQTVQSNLSGKVSAIVALKLDVNGKVIGVQYANDGSTGAITFNADYVEITGDLIVNGSLTYQSMPSGELTPSLTVSDPALQALGTSDVVCASGSIYLESGWLDINSNLAVTNSSGGVADVDASIYVNGVLMDTWPFDVAAGKTRRDSQFTMDEWPTPGWKTVQLRARSSVATTKRLATLNVVNRRR